MSLPYALMAIAWGICLVWVPAVIFTNRKVQPKALFLLFFAELWERFSYYGMRALLVLYMIDTTTGMDYDQDKAYTIYGAYGAMVYATPVIGGLIAEKLFGYRKAILWGGILMALGHFAMAIEIEAVFFIALSLLILGNGFFKPNISSFVGTFYEKGDVRRDRGFNLFYMGINVGAFLTPLTCGTIGQLEGWHFGFGLAGIGMLLGLAVFVIGLGSGVFTSNGKELGLPPKPAMLKASAIKVPALNNEILVYIGTFIAVPLIYLLLNAGDVLDYILMGLTGVLLIYLFFLGTKEERKQGDQINVILILFLFTTLFWTFFELAGSAINVFTDKNIDRNVLGTELPASAFQSINPLFIILFAPIFNWVWGALKRVNLEPPAPVKFAIGVTLLGVGFLMFPLGGTMATNGMVPVVFLILAYLLHTLGELSLSPVGLSLVTKLSPAKLVGFVMGIWFLSSSLAHQIGKFISKSTSSDNLTPVEALDQYTGTFTMVGIIAIGAGALLFGLSFILNKWMHGVR